MNNTNTEIVSINHQDITLLALTKFIEGHGKVSVNYTDSEYHEELKLMLQRMPTAMFVTTCQSCMDVQVTINVPKLLRFAAKVEKDFECLNDFNWAIQAGASNRLLAHLFPSIFDAGEIAKLRSRLSESHSKFTKRKVVRSIVEQEAIVLCWDHIVSKPNLTEIQRYKELFEQFKDKYDLSQLFYVLKDYNLWEMGSM